MPANLFFHNHNNKRRILIQATDKNIIYIWDAEIAIPLFFKIYFI